LSEAIPINEPLRYMVGFVLLYAPYKSVMVGHSRSKDGVASFAYVSAI
jgi:hypothetical protein